MTYPEAIKYLDSFIDYEKIPQYSYKQLLKLERIKEFLNTLNNPQDQLKCIHIAGTKGKGSTCAFIAYILREAGFKVVLYTSPHLSDFRERIRIIKPITESQKPKTEFEGMISERELTDLIEELRPFIQEYNSQSKYGSLSFFEVYTTLAFMYFKKMQVDFCVLETGLGGRLDATNVVNSSMSIMTSISYEHTRQLGKTLSEISYEKTGIIKNHKSIVISAPQEREVREVISKRCEMVGAELYEIGKDIIIEEGIPVKGSRCFNISGAFDKLTNLKIRLAGRHQIINASLAVAAVLALDKLHQVRVNLEAIRAGLYNTIWPGRFEIIRKKPLLILDGAQNPASAQALKQTILENFPGRQIILVFGVSQDKDINGICKVLIPISDEIILTHTDNPRAADVDVIEQAFISQLSGRSRPINKTRSVKAALDLAKAKAGLEDLVLVTGSLFLVGEVRKLVLKN